MSKKTTRYRSAIDGQYVPKKYAEAHPRTTVKETDKPKPTKPTKSKK